MNKYSKYINNILHYFRVNILSTYSVNVFLVNGKVNLIDINKILNFNSDKSEDVYEQDFGDLVYKIMSPNKFELVMLLNNNLCYRDNVIVHACNHVLDNLLDTIISHRECSSYKFNAFTSEIKSYIIEQLFDNISNTIKYLDGKDYDYANCYTILYDDYLNKIKLDYNQLNFMDTLFPNSNVK